MHFCSFSFCCLTRKRMIPVSSTQSPSFPTYLSRVSSKVSLTSGILSAMTVRLMEASLCPERKTTEPFKGSRSSAVTSSWLAPIGRRLQNTRAWPSVPSRRRGRFTCNKHYENELQYLTYIHICTQNNFFLNADSSWGGEPFWPASLWLLGLTQSFIFQKSKFKSLSPVAHVSCQGLVFRSYHAGIAVLRFINHHCAVTGKTNFPIGYIGGDSQGEVEGSPKPWAVWGNFGGDVNQFQSIQLVERRKNNSVQRWFKQDY